MGLVRGGLHYTGNVPAEDAVVMLFSFSNYFYHFVFREPLIISTLNSDSLIFYNLD